MEKNIYKQIVKAATMTKFSNVPSALKNQGRGLGSHSPYRNIEKYRGDCELSLSSIVGGPIRVPKGKDNTTKSKRIFIWT